MEIISTSKPKARKEHTCNYCAGRIQKGEVYERSYLKNDDPYVWKSHLNCSAIATKLDMFNNCDVEGLTDDDFQEMIREAYSDMHNDNKEVSFLEILETVCNHHLNKQTK